MLKNESFDIVVVLSVVFDLMIFGAQVGLVIGKLSSVLDRGFVFDLIPTPSNDAGEPACSVLETRDDKKKPSKSKAQSSESSSLSIDCDWVAEHARQV